MKLILIFLFLCLSCQSSTYTSPDTLGHYASSLDGKRVIVSDSVNDVFKPSQVYRIHSHTRSVQLIGLDNGNDVTIPNDTTAKYQHEILIVDVGGQDVTFRVIGG